MKHILSVLALSTALAAPALAQSHSAHSAHSAHTDHASQGAPHTTDAGAEAVMTAGEVTRVDARSHKLTIRHEEIKNLDMPAMTMVFALQDASLLNDFQPGDKVRFHVEERNTALTITKIERAP